jgi:hypothetical protein
MRFGSVRGNRLWCGQGIQQPPNIAVCREYWKSGVIPRLLNVKELQKVRKEQHVIFDLPPQLT